MQVEKIIGLANLRGCMPFESQTRIGFRHSTTVVDYLDGCPSSIDNDHTHRFSTSIDCILDKFLNNTCRALNHLTSRNLVGYGVG